MCDGFLYLPMIKRARSIRRIYYPQEKSGIISPLIYFVLKTEFKKRSTYSMGLDRPVPPIWGSKLTITWPLSPVDDAAAWLVSITINAGERIESSHQYAQLIFRPEREECRAQDRDLGSIYASPSSGSLSLNAWNSC